MKRLLTEHLEPDMIIARALIDEHGKVLLNEDVKLTPTFIRALAQKGIPCVYIKDADSPVDIPLDDDLDPILRARATAKLNLVFSAIGKVLASLKDQTFDSIQRSLSSDSIKALISKEGPFGELDSVVSDILDDVLDRRTLSGLTSIKTADGQVYSHSVDVCVISIMIGRTLNLPYRQMTKLAKGALLHDIGKQFVDKSENPLTQIRQHTLLGYELLRNDEDYLMPHIALEHHEHQDGDGEPRGLKGTNEIERDRDSGEPVITLVGEIVAIANAYDNLVSGAAGITPLTPEIAIQTIQGEAGTQFNKAVVKAFRKVLPIYPMGTQVLVRSGHYKHFRGVVSKINAFAPDRPVIILVKDNHGNPIPTIEVNTFSEEDMVLKTIGLS